MSETWRSCVLGDLVKIKHGFAFPGSGILSEKTENLLLTPGNFEIGGGFKSGKNKFFNGEVDPEYILPPGEVIVTMTDLSKQGDTLGYSAKVPSSNTFRCLHNQRIGRVIPKNNSFSIDFVYWLMRSKDYRHWIVSRATGSTVKHTSPSRIEDFEFDLPPLSIQKAIARVLGALDDKIELNRATSETLEGIAKALFTSWFVDFDPVRAKVERRPTGLPDEISELFPDSFEDSELGEIPNGWSQTSIGKEANLLTGFPFKSALFANSPPGARLARGMNVKEGFLFWESQSRFWRGGTEEYKKYFLDVGDILIGMDGSKVGKNWVRVRASDLPCLLVQRVARLRHKSSIGETFLRFLVGSAEFTAYVDLVKTGTSIPHISLKQIKEYAFTRPEESDNRLFAAYEEISLPIMRKIDNNYAQSIVLSSLRDYLLPRLVSGELRVPDAEKMLEEVGV